MIKDGQVRKLRGLLANGASLAMAARKTGMDEKTARKYRADSELPSQRSTVRNWRTRKDPFEEVWGEVESQLDAEPSLRAFALFGWLQEQYPGRFGESQRRTFERRVRDWRGRRGPNQEVMFPQHHYPGDLAASDFTSMNSLGVTIAGQPLKHLLYHFTLTYSNWESVFTLLAERYEPRQRPADQQPAIQQVGANIQRRNDHCRCYRPVSGRRSPQRRRDSLASSTILSPCRKSLFEAQQSCWHLANLAPTHQLSSSKAFWKTPRLARYPEAIRHACRKDTIKRLRRSLTAADAEWVTLSLQHWVKTGMHAVEFLHRASSGALCHCVRDSQRWMNSSPETNPGDMGAGHRLCSWGWRSPLVARTHSQLLESTSNVFNPN